jgi:hypothetical protein
MPDDEGMSRMRAMFGPNAVDGAIRQAIQMCWMCLPKENRNIEEVERQLRRILDRAIANAKDDRAAFGNSETE